MFVSIDVYLKRLMTTLEKVIAPEIESDHVRGQVWAVIDLLNQLSGKIEYKSELIAQDLQMGSEMLLALLDTVGQSASPPAELVAFRKELEAGALPCSLSSRSRLEEMISRAIDYFHENQTRLEPKTANELDQKLRDYLTRLATRDLGLMKPPLLEKISRSKR